MTERQKLIAYKQTVQAAKNKLKQMSGISILEILEQNENPGLNEMFSAYTTTLEMILNHIASYHTHPQQRRFIPGSLVLWS